MYNYYPYMQHMAYMNMYQNNKDLEGMYPEIYHRVYPMVKMHCDKMERKYGLMYSPTKKDLDDACDEMYENIKDYLGEIDEKDNENKDRDYDRQRPYNRKNSTNDLLRILLIREILGRRSPYYGYWY